MSKLNIEQRITINANDKTREIESINTELVKIRLHTRKLMTQKKKIENEILDFITSQNQQGLKNKTHLFLKEEKEVLKTKNKTEKELILTSFFGKCPLDDSGAKAKEFLKQKTKEDSEVLLNRFFYYLEDKEDKIADLFKMLEPEIVVQRKLIIKKL